MVDEAAAVDDLADFEHPIGDPVVHLRRFDMLVDGHPEVLERYADFPEHLHRFLAAASGL